MRQPGKVEKSIEKDGSFHVKLISIDEAIAFCKRNLTSFLVYGFPLPVHGFGMIVTTYLSV